MSGREQPATPQTRFWDEEPCPRDDCDGELQHQGNYNVMCINCEAAWMHVTTQEHQQLVDMEFNAVAKRPRLVADGGAESQKKDYRDVEAFRDANPRLSIDDVPAEDRAAVRKAVREFIRDYYRPLDPDMAVEEVFVCGSFANGTASRHISDLDIRVVLSSDFGQEQAEQINALLKNYVTRQVEDAPFGYVDPQCYPESADTPGAGVVL